jgi:urease accessory protein
MLRLLAFSVCGIVIASTASAHTGVGDTAGFAHGFLHPIGGPDHVLAMVAVGLFAATLGGRALWLVPLSFLTMMAAGGAIGIGGVDLPLVELGIGFSVAALGVAIAARLRMPLAAAAALVGFFAIFHGHAHGAEMPNTASGMAYGAGFLIATALLHACGVGLGLSFGMFAERRGRQVAQIVGAAVALTGVGMLAALAVT